MRRRRLLLGAGLVVLAGLAVSPLAVHWFTQDEQKAVLARARSAAGAHASPDGSPPGKEPAYKLPKGGEDWDYIGTFRLRDSTGAMVPVKLYADDSSSKKRANRGDHLANMVPNHFALQAVYLTRTGEWTHRALDSRARMSFSRILKSGEDAVVLELVTNYTFMPQLGQTGVGPIPTASVTVSVKDGVPTAEVR
jgi:hypothetical protein